MKKNHGSILWGLALLALAVYLILDGLNLWNISELPFSPLRLIPVVLCAVWLVHDIRRKKFAEVIFPIGGLYWLLQDTIFYALGNPDGKKLSFWMIFLIAVIINLAGNTLFGSSDSDEDDEDDDDDDEDDEEETHGGHVHVGSYRVGTSERVLRGDELYNVKITDVVGKMDVSVTDPDSYTGGGTIRISDVAGVVKLHLPHDWYVTVRSEDVVGVVSSPEQDRSLCKKEITLSVSDCIGKVTVILV